MIDVCDIHIMKPLLAEHGFHFSKAKGQNFLISRWVPERIAEDAGVDETAGVLELGPGIGPLTQQLCLRAKKVCAVELDRRLQPILAQTVGEFTNLEIIWDDVLKQDVARAMRIADHFGHNPKSYPITLTITVLYGLFMQLFLLNYHMWQSRRRNIPFPSDGELMASLRLSHPFALSELKKNVGRWDNRRVFHILGLLREYDGKSKGIGGSSLDNAQMLNELLLKIFASI